MAKLKKKIEKKPEKGKKRNTNKHLSKAQMELIRELVISVSGINSSQIVDLLYGNENVNEFNISKKMKITINQTRNILYKLGDLGLVSFTRKKDKKNGGWYTYFWTLDIFKSLTVLRDNLEKNIIHFEHQLNSKQTKQFYYCENCDIEMSEENALMHDFTCPECGEVFIAKDNDQSIGDIKEHIRIVRLKLDEVNKEISDVSQRLESLKNRRLKADEKKKKEKRAIARAKNKKLKAKNGIVKKKTIKKKVKKKPRDKRVKKVKKKPVKKKIKKPAKKPVKKKIKKPVKKSNKKLSKKKTVSKKKFKFKPKSIKKKKTKRR